MPNQKKELKDSYQSYYQFLKDAFPKAFKKECEKIKKENEKKNYILIPSYIRDWEELEEKKEGN